MSSWTKRIAVVAGLLVVLAVGVVTYLVLSDTTTPVKVDDAVDRYRNERDATTAPTTVTTVALGTALPAEGVYVYATEGSERIDILGGSTHGYPEDTTVTITHTECGFDQRWTPLEERWDEEQVCETDAGRQRHALRTHHEFFGISDDQDFTCDDGYLLVPARAEVGSTWSTSCTAGGTTLTGTGEVVGFEPRNVDGTTVETVHVRITEEASGSDTGPSRDDYWWQQSDGLLIERVSTVDTRSESPVGTAAYNEAFTLRLTSTTPRV